MSTLGARRLIILNVIIIINNFPGISVLFVNGKDIVAISCDTAVVHDNHDRNVYLRRSDLERIAHCLDLSNTGKDKSVLCRRSLRNNSSRM